MNPKKIVIIGSNSFSGASCVDYFLQHTDAKVIGISRSKEKSPAFLQYLYKKPKPKKNRFQFYQLDINKDLKKITALLDREKPEVIINYAGQSIVEVSWDSPEDWFKTNCLGIVNLTNHLKDKKYLKRYIAISTPEVYGSFDGDETATYFNPTTPYAASKGAGDLFLIALQKKYNFPVIFVRSANVYGPHQQLFKIVPKAIILIKKGQKIPLHQGGYIDRSFIHIDDVSRGMHKILQKGKTGDVFHFSTGHNVMIRDVVQIICKKMGVRFEDAVEISEGRPGQDKTYTLRIKNTSKKLGWKAQISLEKGIQEVVDWVNDCWKEIEKQPLKYIHKK